MVMTVTLATAVHYWLTAVAVNRVTLAIIGLQHTLGIDRATAAAVTTDISSIVV